MTNEEIKKMKEQIAIIETALDKIRNIVDNAEFPDGFKDKGFCLFKISEARRSVRDLES